MGGVGGGRWRGTPRVCGPSLRYAADTTIYVMRSRRAVKCAVLVGLLFMAGAVCSVAVAWGLAWAAATRRFERVATEDTFRNDGLSAFRFSRFGSDEYVEIRASAVTLSRRGANFRKRITIPYWVEPPDPEPGSLRSTHGFGFPFRCVKYEEPVTVSGKRRYAATLDLTGQPPLLLPLWPIVPGLLANSLVFVAVAAGMAALVRNLRRGRRFVRGHCPFCNYDLRGDFSRACSECGRNAVRSRSKG